MSEIRRARRSRGVLAAIFALFALPMALAVALYVKPEWQPQGRVEHGELIQPVRAIGPTDLHDTEGRAVVDPWRGHWTLLYRGTSGCEATCQRALDLLLRICRSQADGRDRVRRALVVQALPPADREALRELDPELRSMVAGTDRRPMLPAGSIYLVDPLGNLVLRYPPGFDPKGLAADIKRLLERSRIG